MILSLAGLGSAHAEPDPEGSPAGPVRIEVAKETANLGYAFTHAKAQLMRTAAGEHYVRIDYTVENRTAATLSSHAWQVDFEGQRVSGTNSAAIPKSGSRSFSRIITGSRLREAPVSWPGTVSLGSGSYPVGYCPDEARQKAACDQLVAWSNAGRVCDNWCRDKEKGLTGTMAACVEQGPPRFACPTWMSPGCQCDGGGGDHTFDSTRAMLDLLQGAPRYDSNPPRWEMRDITPPR